MSSGSLKYGAGVIRSLKAIVRKHGLIKGREIINKDGVPQRGKIVKVSISLPTLSKFVKLDIGGKPVELFRGRPAKKAA